MLVFLSLRRLRHSPAAFCGLIIILLLMLIAPFASWLTSHDPNRQDVATRLQAPSRRHWLSTDSYRRGLLPRLIYDSRPALGPVILVTIIALPVGLLIGILTGYHGGWLGCVLMCFTDVVMPMPRLILAPTLVAMLGPGLVNSALALVLTIWPAYARRARNKI